MAGYVGYSKSVNAMLAESEGKLPLTHAVKEVAMQAGVSAKKARLALEVVGPCEWHHTSKKYNRTDYYCVAEAIIYVEENSEDLDRTLRRRDWAIAEVKAAGGKFAVNYLAESGEVDLWHYVEMWQAKQINDLNLSRMIETKNKGYAVPRWHDAEIEEIIARAGL